MACIYYKHRKDTAWHLLNPSPYTVEYAYERAASLQESFGDWKFEFRVEEKP